MVKEGIYHNTVYSTTLPNTSLTDDPPVFQSDYTYVTYFVNTCVYTFAF